MVNLAWSPVGSVAVLLGTRFFNLLKNRTETVIDRGGGFILYQKFFSKIYPEKVTFFDIHCWQLKLFFSVHVTPVFGDIFYVASS